MQHETVSQSPGPPLKDPPTSPPHLWMGAPWGDCGGSFGARAAPSLFGRPAQRRRPSYLSSGVSADGVTPSAATGAAFESLRSLPGFLSPVFPAARLRAWRVSGGGRSGGRDGTTAQRRKRTDRQFVQRARYRAAGRNPDRDPRARDRAAAPCEAGDHRPCSTLPCARAQRAVQQQKIGAEGPRGYTRPSSAMYVERNIHGRMWTYLICGVREPLRLPL